MQFLYGMSVLRGRLSQTYPHTDYFALYNTEKGIAQCKSFCAEACIMRITHGRWGKASGVYCLPKKCEKSCPQHIEIADKMKRIAEMFEK